MKHNTNRQLTDDELSYAKIIRETKIAEQEAFRKRERTKLVFWILISIFTGLYSYGYFYG